MKNNQKKQRWVHVVDQRTYLCFAPSILGLVKIFFYDITFWPNMMELGTQVFLSLLLIAIGIYLFVRMNSYSAWMNPNHPH